MSSGGGGAPAAPDLYTETSGELKAKSELAPQVFSTEAQYDPQYAGLNLSNMRDFLEGTAASSRTEHYTNPVSGFRNTDTGEFVAGDTRPATTGPFVGGPIGQNDWVPFMQNQDATRTINTPASPGYLSLAGDVSRASDQMAEQSAGRTVSTLMGEDPANTMLSNEATDSASSELANGYNLSPAQMRLVQQSVRAGQSARGQGFGPADTYGEALGVSQFGQQLYQQRLQNAIGAAGSRYNMYTAPTINTLTGASPGTAAPYLQQGYGISSSIGPKLFGSDINAQDVFNTGFNAQSAQAISNNNSNAAMTSAGISGGVGLAGLGILAAAGAF